MTRPSPQQQVDFLHQLQRILADGSFVATYKYALLHALADLAVLHGDDSGAELRLGTRDIAVQLIELYWRQAIPFLTPRGREAVVLRQNVGRQAAILARIREAQAAGGPSLPRFRRQAPAWDKLVRDVDRVLRAMPLWRLQTVGDERLSFLYENLDAGTEITLRPGVAYCLRAFHPLVLDLVRGAWLRYVRTHNAAALGETGELGAFLFGAGRVSLAAYQPILTEIQKGECFYCRRGLRQAGQVDHFVPWARYPVDLGHNFVLAHATCNGAKSDHLAAERHLNRWLERNEEQGVLLARQFDAAGILHDSSATCRIARWAYTQADLVGSPVWEKVRSLQPLSPSWPSIFDAHPRLCA